MNTIKDWRWTKIRRQLIKIKRESGYCIHTLECSRRAEHVNGRCTEHNDYFRQYIRRYRAEKKAERNSVSQEGI